MYLVFSQAQLPWSGEFLLVQKARTFFSAELTFVERHYRPLPHLRARLGLRGAPAVELSLSLREAREEDHLAAEQAEARGRAGGMASLARRCARLWEVPDDAEHRREVMTLCAILAATELGPVMPPDHSTLFGVRGARERADNYPAR